MTVSLKKTLQLFTTASLLGATIAVTPVVDVVVGGPSTAYAQQQEEAAPPPRPTRRTPAMREPTFRRLEKAQIAMEAKDWEGTLEALEDLGNMRNLNSYERAMLHNYYAFYYYEREDVANAIRSYEMVLQQPDIPLGLEDNIRFTVAQLYFSTERYAEAQEYLDLWFRYAPTPNAQAYIFRGQLYYVQELYNEALEPILKAMEITQAAGMPIKENWYLLLRTIYFEQNDLQSMRDILETLIIYYNKPVYWLQLASIYSELQNEPAQLATMEVAYQLGYYERESHYVNLAQLYLYNTVPIKAARVLAAAFEEGLVEQNEKNLELLANSYINAKNFSDAVDPLTRAAALSEDGELSVRLGQVHMEQDNWNESIRALRQGLEKGELNREDQAYVLLGMAYYNNDQLDEAKEAFRQARNDRRSRQTATQWMGYIDRESDRRRRLAASMREN